jgi:tetratricopeptide (TPR) repeat protein
LILVSGEAGIGKTALLTRFVTDLDATVAWGTCWDAGQAPAYWPWTQAIRALWEARPDLAAEAPPELAVIAPDRPHRPVREASTEDDVRLAVFDAVGALLGRAARSGPVVVVLDDLQWADNSTLDLLRYLTRTPVPGPVLLVGAHRTGEPEGGGPAALASLAALGESVPLAGLRADEVADLVAAVAGREAAAEWTAEVVHRSGGHPFLARELIHLIASGRATNAVPAAVREVILGRVARTSTECVRLLEVASVAGADLLPDVLAEATGLDTAQITDRLSEAVATGILRPGPDRVHFAHDLYRETIYASIATGRCLELHQRVGSALAARQARGGDAFAADVARHFATAAAVVGPEPVLVWARAAADVDAARFAFAEAAAHLARARASIAAAGVNLPDPELVELLTAEADAHLRAGDAATARDRFTLAWGRVAGTGDAEAIGAVALGLERLGARFGMPRTDLVAALEIADRALEGSDSTVEAQVAAALARQLQHSVPRDRPRAAPLADRAVGIARRLGDPATLASCLLAQHDVRWTAGTAPQRVAIAAEIAALAERADDYERHAQALLLTASAQLESANPAFRATLMQFNHAAERLRQPRHDYVVRTRAAALALLDGDIDVGEEMVEEAYALGEQVGERDAGNVRMSQRLEVARARGDGTLLRATAAEAVRWWVGVPKHAHAIAAGFFARAGEFDEARRELDVVRALPEAGEDRSYLWSVYVGELAVAAIALHDHPLCTELLDQLLPIASTCAVNGALVCFGGAHAHRVGLLCAELGRSEEARNWLRQAHRIHLTLGARAWAAETEAALAALEPGAPRPASPGAGAITPAGPDRPTLRREGELWLVGYRGRQAHLRDAKGLHDLAVLLNRPGVDVPALELAGNPGPIDADTAPALDRVALSAYRRRLAELDEELATARDGHDAGRLLRAGDERERLLSELRRSTRPDGTARGLGPTSAERARKAVSGRIREAVRRIGQVLPELGSHLDRRVRTGTLCRYDP